MIDMDKYKYRPNTMVGRLREFLKSEVGSQPFTVTQLVRAVMDNDASVAKRDAESVRDGATKMVQKMYANGELDVISGDKRGKVYVLKQGGGE
jgi:hypothetical protein